MHPGACVLWICALLVGSGHARAAAADTAQTRLEAAFIPPPAFATDLGTYRPILVFNDGRPVYTATDWQVRRREISAFWNGALGAWPPLIDRPRCTVVSSEPRDALIQQRVRLQVAPDEELEGWLLVPNRAGPFPAVLIPYYDPDTSIGRGTQPLRDFGYQLAKRGFVTLSIGSPGGDARQPRPPRSDWQPLSYLACVAANAHTVLAQRPGVDPRRIGVVGHSYGGKWALFAACLDARFACCVVSDPGIVWDETRPNVNYWEPWYLGRDAARTRPPGLPSPENPRTGAYRHLYESGHDLHELHALLAPRPLLVSGGAEDPPERWRALNHLVAVNRLLGVTNRVALTTRPGHDPTPESNAEIYAFFEMFLGPRTRATGPAGRDRQ